MGFNFNLTHQASPPNDHWTFNLNVLSRFAAIRLNHPRLPASSHLRNPSHYGQNHSHFHFATPTTPQMRNDTENYRH